MRGSFLSVVLLLQAFSLVTAWKKVPGRDRWNPHRTPGCISPPKCKIYKDAIRGRDLNEARNTCVCFKESLTNKKKKCSYPSYAKHFTVKSFTEFCECLGPYPPAGTPVKFNPAIPMSYEKCRWDPFGPTPEFIPLDGRDGVAIKEKNGYAVRNVDITEKNNPPIPYYKFEKVSGAPTGIYDIVMGTGSKKQYLAVLNDGQVVFTDRSSRGNKFVEGRGSIMSGRKYVTTFFALDCDGRLKLGFKQGSQYEFQIYNNATYAYPKTGTEPATEAGYLTELLLLRKAASNPIPSDENTKAALPELMLPPPEEPSMEIVDGTPPLEDDGPPLEEEMPETTTSSRRDVGDRKYSNIDKRWERNAQNGIAPRCNYNPSPLIAFNKDNSAGTTNGCGSGKFDVPDFIFGGCCNEHDLCFDDCNRYFEPCNDDFRGCMLGACRREFGSFFAWASGCNNLAHFYADVVSSLPGMFAFYTANENRCKCKCRPPLGYCDGQCKDFSFDNDNCGACRTKCLNGSMCQNNKCVCPNGGKACKSTGRCTDVAVDNNNCGNCGVRCVGGQTCKRGKCTCPPGHVFCTDKCVEGTKCEYGRCEGPNLIKGGISWADGAAGLQINVADVTACCEKCYSYPGCSAMYFFDLPPGSEGYNCHMISPRKSMGPYPDYAFGTHCDMLDDERLLLLKTGVHGSAFGSKGNCYREE